MPERFSSRRQNGHRTIVMLLRNSITRLRVWTPRGILLPARHKGVLMQQRRAVLLFALILSLLSACRSGTPITPSGVTQDRAMYQATINTFFRDGQVQRLIQPDSLQHKIVFIRTTFGDTNTPLPADIIQMITSHTTAYGLVHVQTEQAGGLVITISSIGTDPAASTVYQQRGPTISIGARVSDISCGASIDSGYLITAHDTGRHSSMCSVFAS